MLGRHWAVCIVLGLATLCGPSSASATTVTLGDRSVSPHPTGTRGCNCTLAQSFLPTGELAFAPAHGEITSWLLRGTGTVKLSVLESAEPEGWVNVATSSPATNLEGGPNATSLPIGFDDMIGVTFSMPLSGGVGFNEVPNDEVFLFRPELAVEAAPREPEEMRHNEHLEVGAEEVLAPVLSALSPATGAAAGGNAVTISGKYLDGATNVTFGAAPAASFSVESSTEITAIAPPTTPSTVDVRVIGPGGSSEISPADHYTFASAGGPSGTTPPPAASTGSAPAVTAFKQSASRWKRGGAAPRISSAPLGTTFSFSLNEPASATLLFTRKTTGRKVRGRCVATTAANRAKPRCSRTVSAGSLAFTAHAGANKIVFQGRLPGHAKLTPGSYAVALMVRDAEHRQATSPSLAFTIIPG